MANQPTAENRLIDRRSVLRGGRQGLLGIRGRGACILIPKARLPAIADPKQKIGAPDQSKFDRSC
jgi:hypothetical protein